MLTHKAHIDLVLIVLIIIIPRRTDCGSRHFRLPTCKCVVSSHTLGNVRCYVSQVVTMFQRSDVPPPFFPPILLLFPLESVTSGMW